MESIPSFSEHYVPIGQGRVYVRDYPGADPAFVLMHGFPDNLHIYDELIPYLVAGGRRVVTFDFLGFGASDKPAGATYSFQQQLQDMEGVVDALGLDRIVPVAHDASGPAGINFTLAHPERVASLCILNSAYDDALPVHWPEMIELFATKSLNALSGAIAQSPEQLGWLLAWQPNKFRDAQPSSQRAHFETVTEPLIADNFIGNQFRPSIRAAGVGFLRRTCADYGTLARVEDNQCPSQGDLGRVRSLHHV